MKLWALHMLAKRLGCFNSIKFAKRVSDNAIKIEFDAKHAYLFDMSKGESIAHPDNGSVSTKKYRAPFDIALEKKLSNASLVKVHALEADRVLIFECAQKQGYKQSGFALRLEFTGRHTNAILLSVDGIVEAALRYVTSEVSTRPVVAGEKLPPLPENPNSIPSSQPPSIDIDVFLSEAKNEALQKRLNGQKNSKISVIEKKLFTLQMRMSELSSEDELLQKSEEAAKTASLLLVNIERLNVFEEKALLTDFDGSIVTVVIPPVKSASLVPQYYFNLAKKLRKKAQNQRIQRENLQEKIDFLNAFKEAVRLCSDEESLRVLCSTPKEVKNEAEPEPSTQHFEIEGFRVLLGKNEKANENLLKNSKSNDIWLHLKNIASTHVIIQTNKKDVPQAVVEAAAKLCAAFSVQSGGVYEVDYAKRRDVSPSGGANVTYVNYKTVRVRV